MINHRKKPRRIAVIAALLSLVLAFAMTTIGCPHEPGNGNGSNPTGVPAELLGKWVNQSGTTSPYSIVVLEFTATQLKISDTSGDGVSTYFAKGTAGKIEIGTSSDSLDQTFCDSYEITAGVLTLTGGTSADDYPSMDFYKVDTLTNGQWKDGAITSESKGQVWYSFNVTAEIEYRMWWNDGYDGLFGASEGDGTKSLDIYVSSYYSSGTSIFNDADAAWSTARSFTPAENSTVYVKVTPYSFIGVGVGVGTFGIVYSTETEKPDAPFNPPSPTPLTAGQWKDGEITSGSSGEVWYSFSVTAGIVYNVWWNESGDNGNGIKTLNVSVRGFYSNGETISDFSTTTTAWDTAKSFTPAASGTVYLRVTAGTSTGTFGIVYNTGNADRPVAQFNPPNPTPLTAGEWKDGEITSGSYGWYSLTVTAETPYYFWWNESGNYGNGMKSLDISVSAYNSDGTVINDFNNVDTAWADAKSFTPTTSGTIYLRVAPYYSSNTGTYGIVYSTTDSRPVAPFNPPNPIPLTTDVWANGELTSSIREVWYSFTVTSGTAYRVWWNDSYGGNSTKTGDVYVAGFYNDGTSAFARTDSGWTTAQSFTPTANDTVYIRITAASSLSTGTFGVAYSTSSTRPTIIIDLPTTDVTSLTTANTWVNGNIATGGQQWFKFTATATPQYIHIALGTLSDLYVQVYDSDGLAVGAEENIFTLTTNKYISRPVTASQTYYIRVWPYSSNGSGTYQIGFNTSNTPPPVVLPTDATALTADTWASGNIATSSGQQWFTFTATATPQYIHIKLGTLDYLYVQVYDSNGNTVSTEQNIWSSSTNKYISRTVTANQPYYIRVWPYGNYSGNYQIAFNTSSTAPANP